jgi:hypothetical protein
VKRSRSCWGVVSVRRLRGNMTIPRAERLRITQEVYKQWQEIYGEREDAEAESANWDMLNKAMAEAEEKYKDRPANL